MRSRHACVASRADTSRLASLADSPEMVSWFKDINIEHPTSNTQHPIYRHRPIRWMFDVGCSMLDVFSNDYSTIFGTMNGPFAFPGAFRKASSFGSDARTSSARTTLVIGTAWAVGSTWVMSNSLSFSI